MLIKARLKITAVARLIWRLLRERFKPLWHRGARGELYTTLWLLSRGCLIWERNWRTRFGEIDIVASLGRSLFIVEVKTRSERSADFLRPGAAVDDEKLARLQRLAKAYIARKPDRTRRARIKQFQIVTIEVIDRGVKSPKISPILHEPCLLSSRFGIKHRSLC